MRRKRRREVESKRSTTGKAAENNVTGSVDFVSTTRHEEVQVRVMWMLDC